MLQFLTQQHTEKNNLLAQLFVIIWTAKVFVKSTNRNLLDKVWLDSKADKTVK